MTSVSLPVNSPIRCVLCVGEGCTDDAQLQLGLFDNQLELIEGDLGAQSVFIAKIGCQTSTEPGGQQLVALQALQARAAITTCLVSMPAAVKFIILAAVVNSCTETGCSLNLMVEQGGSIIHQIHRIAASGSPGTLLAALTRNLESKSQSAGESWYLYNICQMDLLWCVERVKMSLSVSFIGPM